jgi:hypothetical protein
MPLGCQANPKVVSHSMLWKRKRLLIYFSLECHTASQIMGLEKISECACPERSDVGIDLSCRVECFIAY